MNNKSWTPLSCFHKINYLKQKTIAFAKNGCRIKERRNESKAKRKTINVSNTKGKRYKNKKFQNKTIHNEKEQRVNVTCQRKNET